MPVEVKYSVSTIYPVLINLIGTNKGAFEEVLLQIVQGVRIFVFHDK